MSRYDLTEFEWRAIEPRPAKRGIGAGEPDFEVDALGPNSEAPPECRVPFGSHRVITSTPTRTATRIRGACLKKHPPP